MGQSSTQTEPGNRSRRRITRLPWAVSALVLLSLLASFQLLRHRHKDVNPFLGDSDMALAGVAEVLDRTPAEQRVPLLRKYARDANPGLRYAAVDALGATHRPEVADDIERAFMDSASLARQRALETLPQVDPKRGLRLLLAGLRDEDTWIREAAATQLLQYVLTSPADGKLAIPTLIRSLDDPGYVVPTTGMNILQKLTGEPWRIRNGTPPQERQAAIRHWKDWWERERDRYAIPAAFADIAPIRPNRSDPAPDFRLTDIDGREVSLTGQRGRVTLLTFWGTWCPPCQAEVPDLIRVDSACRSRGLDIIGVAMGEQNGAEGVRQWCKAHGVMYRQALSTETIQENYGHIEEVPVSVLIDRQGRIRYRWEGERDYATFAAAVERLLSEAPTQ
jgi:cytochrome c biogenesis protein CcmG/thiol:disulfide interchange protein DsbE